MPSYQKLLLLLAFILPFSFALSPTETVDLNILKLLIPLIFLFWLADSLFNKKIILDNRPRFWLFLFFLLIVFLSYFWTTAPENALRKVLFFFSTLPLYFVFYTTNINFKFQQTFLKILFLSGFLVAIVSLIFFVLQFILGLNPVLHILRVYVAPFFLGNAMTTLINQYSSWLVNISGKTILRTFGTFPDPHLFSLYLSMLTPIGIYLYKKYAQSKYLFFSIVITLAVLFSFSRAAYLAIITGSLFLFFTTPTKNFFKKKILVIYTGFVFLLLLFIMPNPFINRFKSSFNFQEGSNSGRIEMWLVAIDNIKESPLVGLGLGGFGNKLNSTLGIRNPIYAHNLLLDFGAETGIFNAFILFIILISPILSYLSYKKTILNNQSSLICPRPLARFIATSFVIFFVHSLFETPFFSIRVFPLFLILLAINTEHTKNH